MILEPHILGLDMDIEEVKMNLPSLLHDCIKSVQTTGLVPDFLRIFDDLPPVDWTMCLDGIEILQKLKIWESIIVSSQLTYQLLQQSLKLQRPYVGQLMKICLRDSELRQRFLRDYVLLDTSASFSTIEKYSHTINLDLALNFDQYCLIFNSPDNIRRPIVLNLLVGLLDELCQNRISLKHESIVFLEKVRT
jgi:hypothetical protein